MLAVVALRLTRTVRLRCILLSCAAAAAAAAAAVVVVVVGSPQN